MKRRSRGFTLIELLVVFAIVATLLSIITPRYLHQTDRAKEAALQENLASLRIALDQYYADKGEYPETLPMLVKERYLRRIPVDPMTGKTDWKTEMLDAQGRSTIQDVHSMAVGVGMNGSAYRSW